MKRATYFVVEGAGAFPYDMLRYDSCAPVMQADAAAMEHHRDERRRVALTSWSNNAPTAARWRSFTWSVVGTAASTGDADRLARAAPGEGYEARRRRIEDNPDDVGPVKP